MGHCIIIINLNFKKVATASPYQRINCTLGVTYRKCSFILINFHIRYTVSNTPKRCKIPPPTNSDFVNNALPLNVSQCITRYYYNGPFHILSVLFYYYYFHSYFTNITIINIISHTFLREKDDLIRCTIEIIHISTRFQFIRFM